MRLARAEQDDGGRMELRPIDRAVRARVSGQGVRAFRNVAELWGLTERERIALLGDPPRSTYHQWMKQAREERPLTLPLDTLLRISGVLGVQEGLGSLFSTPGEALVWLEGPHRGVAFGGQAPLAVMLGGGQDGILSVRRHLDAWRAGGLRGFPRGHARAAGGSRLRMTPAGVESLPTVAAPERTHRLVPSRHPPVQALEGVASAHDLAAVLELAGWTSDAVVETRLRRLDPADWVFGRPNTSVVMAAFLHGSPGGLRFTSAALGAWYASSRLETAVLEVVNGLRREIAESALTEKAEAYREYTARLAGQFVDLRGGYPELHDPDPARYLAPQAFGEAVRESARAGLAYDSVRDPGGENWVAYRPRLVLDVRQAGHFRTTVRLAGKVVVERLG